MTPEMYRIPYMSFGGSLLTSLLGFAIVFLVLIVLQYMIVALRGIVEKRAAEKTAEPAPAMTPAAPKMTPARGSLGEVRLHSVDDKTAALIMAIVANETGAPLNELRFISIREKK